MHHISINNKNILFVLALVVSIAIGLLSVTHGLLLVLIVGTVLLFSLKEIYLLGLYFIFAQLIYLIPSMTSINGLEIRISDPFLFILIIKIIIRKIHNGTDHVISKKTFFSIGLFLTSCGISLLKGTTIFPVILNISQYVTFLRWFMSFVLLLIIPSVLNNEKEIVNFSKFVIILIFIQSILSLFNFVNASSLMRASNETGSIADYAISLILMISILYSFILNKIGNVFINYMLILFLTFSLYITFTRAAMITFIVVTVLFFFSNKFTLKKVTFLYLLIFTSIILLIQFKDAFIQRFIDDISSDSGSFSERLKLMISGIQGIKDDPLFGKGWSSFRLLKHSLIHSEPHSFYIQIALDNGLVGLSIFIILLRFFYIKLRENRNKISSQYLGAISTGIHFWFAGMLIWLAVDQLLPGTITNLYFWGSLGIALAINRVKDNDTANT